MNIRTVSETRSDASGDGLVSTVGRSLNESTDDHDGTAVEHSLSPATLIAPDCSRKAAHKTSDIIEGHDCCSIARTRVAHSVEETWLSNETFEEALEEYESRSKTRKGGIILVFDHSQRADNSLQSSVLWPTTGATHEGRSQTPSSRSKGQSIGKF